MNSAIRMLDQTAARFGDRTAAQDEHGTITFSGLRSAALSVAAGLLRAEQGVGGLNPVIVYLPKGIAGLVCFAGALYSGNPYVPVDSAIPLKRLQSIADSMKTGHLVTCAPLRQNLEELRPGGLRLHLYEELLRAPADAAAAEARVGRVIDTDPVYIMHTSGSTGVPKGVTIPHRGIIDYAAWLRDTFAFDEHTVLGNQSAFYFDNSTFDIYTMLLTGAKMVVIPEVLFRYPAKLPEFLIEHEINTIFWVPTVMIAVANSGALEKYALPRLKKVLFCGEAMPNRQLNVWRRCQPDRLYANLYGPTEITDVCTYYVVDRAFGDAEPLPIGRARENMRALVLTDGQQPAAPGEIGELCVQGSALARGYWNAPEPTRGAFVQNPLRPEYDDRLYRTGDLAYVDRDGLLMLVGRRDSQIKLRGNRIELGDIETAAGSLPEIRSACAVFDAEKQEIVLFAETDASFTLRGLNAALKTLVPAYMLPGRLVCVAALPQTPNGKIDRALLKSSLSRV